MSIPRLAVAVLKSQFRSFKVAVALAVAVAVQISNCDNFEIFVQKTYLMIFDRKCMCYNCLKVWFVDSNP